MLDINKQAMKYSLQGQTVIIYERDDEGNILYEGYTDREENGNALVSFDKGQSRQRA